MKKTQTKTQIEAAARRDQLKKYVLKALVKKPRAMSEIIARLYELAAKPNTPDFGSPTPTRLRPVLAAYVESGEVIREGVKRTTTYRKAS